MQVDIAVLLGFTTTDELMTGFLGVESSRALSQQGSIAVAVEASPSPINRSLVGLGALYRELGPFALLFGGIGFETSPGRAWGRYPSADPSGYGIRLPLLGEF